MIMTVNVTVSRLRVMVIDHSHRLVRDLYAVMMR